MAATSHCPHGRRYDEWCLDCAALKPLLPSDLTNPRCVVSLGPIAKPAVPSEQKEEPRAHGDAANTSPESVKSEAES